MTTILIVDDDPVQRRLVEGMVRRFGYEPIIAGSGEEALALMAGGQPPVDLVLLDLVMPDLDGMGVLSAMRERNIALPVIVQTAHGSIETVVSAMRAGAVDFVVKPVGAERLQVSIANALRAGALEEEIRRMKRRVEGSLQIRDISTRSEAMRRTLQLAERAARSSIPVLIEGESGVGKEVLARAIQGSGERKGKPFVTVNCGAIPENLVESTLFGHEKGAFTGAVNEKPGCFELADGGTLFLDEIAEMEPDIQVKLLRALEQRSFRRLGGKKEIRVDIRVIAATNQDVQEALRTGKLREDVYHRLAVIPITLPPLRDRPGDVRLLAEEFLRRFAQDHGKKVTGFTEGAIEFLETYRWPGNVRELKNAVERAVILAKGEAIDVTDLQPRHLDLDEKEVRIPVGTSLQEAERLLTLKTFAFTGGDYKKTARMLGVKEKDVRERLLGYFAEQDAR